MGKKFQEMKKNGRKHNSYKKKENSVLSDSSQLIPIKDGHDRISDLPDDLLRHIVSLICYNSDSDSDGKAMLLLSTRWWDFWNRTLVQDEDGSVYAMAVSTLRFLVSCTYRGRALDCLRKLVFHSHGSGQVLVATMTKNKKLHMDFSHGQDDDDDSSVDWWASLWLMLSYLPCPQPSIILPIVSISLTCVNLPCNDGIDVVSWLLSNIPSLHTIEIRGSKGLCDIDVPSDIGKRLISLSIIDCQVNLIKINGSFNLRSFRYRGRCPSIIEISLAYSIWSGRDLMLDLREGPLRMNGPLKNLLKISPSLRLARYLTMCQWTFEAMIRPTLASSYTRFPNFQYLTELWWIDKSMDEENIESLTTFLKECVWLQKLFVTTDPRCYYHPSDGGRKTGRPKCCKESELSFLQFVRMDGFEQEEDELLLADAIISIAKREPIILATSRKPYVRRLMKVKPDCPRMFVKDNHNWDIEAQEQMHMHMRV